MSETTSARMDSAVNAARQTAVGTSLALLIAAWLSRRIGLTPDLSTIHHHLRRLGLRRKKSR